MSRFGVPRQLYTDQGRNFESRLFQEMCKVLEIDKTRTTPLRPQSGGMVESFDRTLEAMLFTFVDTNLRNWDLYLPLLMLAYCSSVHESTGLTPNEMMFGREVLLLLDLLIGQAETTENNSETEYAAKLCEQIKQVREHLKVSSDWQKKNYDHHSVNQYRHKRGYQVWLYCPQRKKGICLKLMRSFDGPYLVIKRVSDLVYRIQKCPNSKPNVVHHGRLKVYHGPNAPDWLTDIVEHEQPGQPIAPQEPVQADNPIP